MENLEIGNTCDSGYEPDIIDTLSFDERRSIILHTFENQKNELTLLNEEIEAQVQKNKAAINLLEEENHLLEKTFKNNVNTISALKKILG